MAADIDPTNPGLEMWSSASGGVCDIRGEVIDSTARIPINFGIWWDGDLLRELLDHETVSKYIPSRSHYRDGEEGLSNIPFDFTGSSSHAVLMKLDDVAFNNGTKSNPALCADIIGDWREEIIARTTDNKHLRIYVSPINTPYRFHSFLTDPVYRHSVVMQNVGYNQPTNVGFYFGAELEGSGRTFRGWKF
jgi:rhamnogalacturonan endolyase